VSFSDVLIVDSLHQANPDIKIQFGFNHRYLSHYRSLKETIVSGKYGQPLWVRGVYGKGFDKSFFEGWRANKTLAGGGIFFDQGIHMLDMIINLLGDLEVVNVLMDKDKNGFGIDINMFIHFRSKEGVPVSLHSSMLQWRHKLTLEIGTEEAVIGIDGIMSSTKSYGNETVRIDRHWRNNFVESEINEYSNPDYYTFRKECIDFINSIINDVPIANGTIKDALRIMKLVDDIYSYK
jgi:predicted dehydrogenase